MFRLNCDIRDRTVKAVKYKKLGYIPGIVYGKNLDEPICIAIDEWRMVTVIRQDETGAAGELVIGGRVYDVIIKEFALNEETNRLEHVDFQYVGESKEMIKRISVKDPETKKRVAYETYEFTEGEVSFLASETIDRIDELERKGICMKKFKGDLVTSGIDYTSKHVGDRFRIGDTEFAVIRIGKPCHQRECGIYEPDRACLLQEGIMFAEVVKGGKVKVSDGVVWEGSIVDTTCHRGHE